MTSRSGLAPGVSVPRARQIPQEDSGTPAPAGAADRGEPAEPSDGIGGPQALFRVSGYRPGPDGTELSMAVGPWLDGVGGTPAVGALGILADDVLGRPVFVSRPPGTHLVTFELSVEVVLPPPWVGPRLLATGTVVAIDAARGLSRCEIVDGTGRLVATGRAHLRIVPAGWSQPEGIRASTLTAAADLSARDTLGPAGSTGAGRGGPIVVPNRPEFGNGSGAVHGGILFCGSEQAAAAADPQGRLTTASVTIHYLRRADLADPVVYEVQPEHQGRSVAVYRVTARGSGGRPCSIATVARTVR
ncbi:PaaI family thioesterase [Frankia sp. Cpl3]|uniref:PaaI family thioesterase n=1 Tax=Parafrankia colletiae TaxID=573497 RepID=UPI001F5287B4|nr:PaaI family thioesterase [Parafrankia colletiae]MCK9902916.1 PaaI family thioesterase [Frankia sp. Cpl3]